MLLSSDSAIDNRHEPNVCAPVLVGLLSRHCRRDVTTFGLSIDFPLARNDGKGPFGGGATNGLATSVSSPARPRPQRPSSLTSAGGDGRRLELSRTPTPAPISRPALDVACDLVMPAVLNINIHEADLAALKLDAAPLPDRSSARACTPTVTTRRRTAVAMSKRSCALDGLSSRAASSEPQSCRARRSSGPVVKSMGTRPTPLRVPLLCALIPLTDLCGAHELWTRP
jgi:hypothetical protein